MSHCCSFTTITLTVDKEEKLHSFQINASCKQKSTKAESLILKAVKGLPLEDISQKYLHYVLGEQTLNDEESFFLQHEWDTLKTCIGRYCNKENDTIEQERCRIDSIHQKDELTIIEATMLTQQTIND